jgi:hypothetical protein
MIETLGQKNVKHLHPKEVKHKSISLKNGEKNESVPCATTRHNFLIKFVASSSVIIACPEVGKIILDMDYEFIKKTWLVHASKY